MLPVESGACTRSDIDRAEHLPVRRIEGVQHISGSKPDVLTVIRDSMDVIDTRKGTILTNDFGRRSTHAWMLSLGSGAGSNKVVVNPGTGGLIQRRARPRPNDCTLPAAPSESSARYTVRWLVASASARAELDQDSPSARKASTRACSSSTGGARTTTSRARRGASANPRFVALTRARSEAPCEAARLRPATARDAIH